MKERGDSYISQEVKDTKEILKGRVAREQLLEGAKAVHDAVSTTYGPKGQNVLIEKTYGRPVLTRDGVTVAKEVYFKERAKNMGAQLVIEASQSTNRVAGDGTSATSIVTYHLMKQAIEAIAAGRNPMEVRDEINEGVVELLEQLEKLAKPVAKGQLEQVATVSSGDANLGKLIAEAVEYVGSDGGVITEKSPIAGVEREYIEGYYLQQGFNALTEGRKELINPHIVVASKKISSHIDVLEMLQKIQKDTPTQALRVAFFGEIQGDAYNTIVANVMQGKLDAVIIQTPPAGDMGVQYLEDLAIYTGANLITEGDQVRNFNPSYLGAAERIVVTTSTCSVFGGQYVQEDLDGRLDELKKRIKNEENPHIVEKIKDRMAKLEGKLALFRIGGATETEREEKEYRIEDAIQSTRAAYRDGVVAGGGATLIELSRKANSLWAGAFQSTFKKLVGNANLSPEVKLNEALGAEYPIGFNLRKDDQLRDMIKEGILDSKLVVEQIIENAGSIAGNAITTGVVITFVDKEE